MIRLLVARARIVLVGVAIALSISAITLAQATEPAIESVPEAETDAVDNARSTPGAPSTETNPSAEPEPATAIGVESQRRLNEFRSEYLNDRADTLNRWLDFVAIVLTFFAVAVALAGFLGFRRFREIETEAKSSVEKVKSSVEVAENLVREIKATKDESQKILQKLRNLNAESVDKEPRESGSSQQGCPEQPRGNVG